MLRLLLLAPTPYKNTNRENWTVANTKEHIVLNLKDVHDRKVCYVFASSHGIELTKIEACT